MTNLKYTLSILFFSLIIIEIFIANESLQYYRTSETVDAFLLRQYAINRQYLLNYNRTQAYHLQWSLNIPTEYTVTIYDGNNKVIAIIPKAKWCDMEVTKWEKVK